MVLTKVILFPFYNLKKNKNNDLAKLKNNTSLMELIWYYDSQWVDLF
jgi:hypothetical protein